MNIIISACFFHNCIGLFITKGTMVAGGVSKVYEYNKNTGRLDMFKYVKLF